LNQELGKKLARDNFCELVCEGGGGKEKDIKKKLDRKEEAHGKRHLSTTENDLELNANS
jgi:hypothetical protein